MYDLHLFEAVSKSHVLTLERKGLECVCMEQYDLVHHCSPCWQVKANMYQFYE
jgi:hypothetical protein